MWGWDWGAVGSIGTAAAVFVALGQLGAGRFQRKQDEKRRQAGEVAVWIEEWHGDRLVPDRPRTLAATYIQNASKSPIYEVVICLVPIGQDGPQESGESMSYKHELTCFQRKIGTCPPGIHAADLEKPAGVGVAYGVEIAFTDAGGMSWVRRGDGELQELRGKRPEDGRRFNDIVRWVEGIRRVPSL